MLKVLENAIDRLKTLSPERQADPADVLEGMAAAGDGVYRLTDEERRLVREGLDELDRGLRATPSEVRAVFDKYRA